MPSHAPTHLLSLPLDILQQIFYDAFFTGIPLDTKTLDTGVRTRTLFKVKPFNCREKNGSILACKPSALLSVCKQFQAHATPVLYKNLFIDLNYAYDHERAPQFLESISSANAALVRVLRFRLSTMDAVLPRCTFVDMVHSIARGFQGLEKLILVYPMQDGESGFYRRIGVDEDKEVARRVALLRGTLAVLDGKRIEVERYVGGVEGNEGGVRVRYEPASSSSSASGSISTFTPTSKPSTADLTDALHDVKISNATSFQSWSRLPEPIKRKIVEKTVLPPEKAIHPLLHASSFPETNSIMPLLLTCKEVSRITADVVYRDAMFMCCCRRDRDEMYNFFTRRTREQRQMIQRYYVNSLDHFHHRNFTSFLKKEYPQAIHMEPLFGEWNRRHPCWRVQR